MFERIRRLRAFQAAMEELSSMDEATQRDLWLARSDFGRIAAIYAGLLQPTEEDDQRIDKSNSFRPRSETTP